MDESLIAPCGMNCGLCVSYLARKHDINTQGFHKSYCPGCIARGKNCTFMKQHCDLLGKGKVRYCFQCDAFPCDRLKALDLRYRTKYHLSMIDNLTRIKNKGIGIFLLEEEEKWKCRKCGDVVCCHNGLCLNCDLERLKTDKKYRWGGDKPMKPQEVS
ncbi:MAG: hypothetical protein A2Y20_08620 [Firmicutes bacterium GWF2_51_9]|nr:MAG: hypothetical protein A2Y20_08620 [Firmicutes bacterium GWF2_51_9]OGS58436.1 MAG: hypothetical protein A2Y19_08690 [Firmicutes bacterium GWE2_51_13]HAM63374.1 hypothetical protein [Erysipelotrichaceae bacterium]HBZ40938.1 hypothetical protein [Erysipelotrichaceae bacterium]